MDKRETQTNPKVQKAVAFFTQAGLARVLARLREKYIEQGRVGGQIVLAESTLDERRELASFLGTPPVPEGTLKIRLADVDKTLRQSGFACTLPDLLSAFFPDQPLVTRPEKRATHAAHQESFQTALQAIIAALPAISRGRAWLEQGKHGTAWLFSRFKNATNEEQERQLSTISYVATILDQLPGSAAPQHLAVFAQKTSGDPHKLDPEKVAGRLLLLALSDLGNASSSLQDRTQKLSLYNEAGLLVDTISSSVAVFNLADATFQDGSPDLWVQAAGERVLLLPLRQLLAWRQASPFRRDIYVFENPQVFESVIAGLNGPKPWPTLICTAGWPSVAALTLLDLLLAASSNYSCSYSGDFDLKGLQIAAYLLSRYPDQCHPWHLDPHAYTAALQTGGIAASMSELNQLHTLPTSFVPLVASIQKQKKWAYQEGITHILLNSILSRDRDPVSERL
jgi:uncharacterized protein (TIGR02679 family)